MPDERLTQLRSTLKTGKKDAESIKQPWERNIAEMGIAGHTSIRCLKIGLNTVGEARQKLLRLKPKVSGAVQLRF
jgi:hypothetical protein